jgi:hypothetical protein
MIVGFREKDLDIVRGDLDLVTLKIIIQEI